jgi:hypothetical protein
MALVHFVPRGDETSETKPPSVNMTLKQLKQYSLIKRKELPLGVRYGAI